ncbi:hypothetical protein GCM10009764_82080 [Nocardia ninae]|uniref:Uncharacterized protein n=1 Tax=Nocardia ninae NBRC 108245 TaxID=1210091 RepID=A0A511M7E5_9NOCA|nr:hypothetical protein NN4_10940 [Nocardia ninae NBRC 108245]
MPADVHRTGGQRHLERTVHPGHRLTYGDITDRDIDRYPWLAAVTTGGDTDPGADGRRREIHCGGR